MKVEKASNHGGHGEHGENLEFMSIATRTRQEVASSLLFSCFSPCSLCTPWLN